MSWDSKQFNWSLTTRRFGREFEYFDRLDSTNLWLSSNLTRFSLPGSVVIAEHQTRGRGRHQRQWQDHPGHSLLCSVLLFVKCPISSPGILSLLPAVALANAIVRHDTSAPVSLKWPNDVLIGDKKVAGILAESHSKDGVTYYVVGVGANVSQNRRDFTSQELRNGSSIHAESSWRPSRETLLALLLNEWEVLFDTLLDGKAAKVIEGWEIHGPQRGALLQRCEAGTVIQGLFEGLGDAGQIKLRDAEGALHEFHSGDIVTA